MEEYRLFQNNNGRVCIARASEIDSKEWHSTDLVIGTDDYSEAVMFLKPTKQIEHRPGYGYFWKNGEYLV